MAEGQDVSGFTTTKGIKLCASTSTIMTMRLERSERTTNAVTKRRRGYELNDYGVRLSVSRR